MPGPSPTDMQEILRAAMGTAFVRFIKASGGQVQVKLGDIDDGIGFDFRVAGDTAYFIAREVPQPKKSAIMLAPAGALNGAGKLAR